MKTNNQKEKKNVSTVAGILAGTVTGAIATFAFMTKKNKKETQEAYEVGFFRGYKGCLDNNTEAANFYNKLAEKYSPATVEDPATEETAPEAKPESESEAKPETTPEAKPESTEPETV